MDSWFESTELFLLLQLVKKKMEGLGDVGIKNDILVSFCLRLLQIFCLLIYNFAMNFQELVLQKLDVIAADVAVLKQDVAVLKQDVAVLKQDVAVLKQDVAVLKQDVAVLKQDVAFLKEDLKAFKEEMREFKKEMWEFKRDSSEERKVSNKRLDQLWEERQKTVVGLSRWFALLTFAGSIVVAFFTALITGKGVVRLP